MKSSVRITHTPLLLPLALLLSCSVFSFPLRPAILIGTKEVLSEKRDLHTVAMSGVRLIGRVLEETLLTTSLGRKALPKSIDASIIVVDTVLPALGSWLNCILSPLHSTQRHRPALQSNRYAREITNHGGNTMGGNLEMVQVLRVQHQRQHLIVRDGSDIEMVITLQHRIDKEQLFPPSSLLSIPYLCSNGIPIP